MSSEGPAITIIILDCRHTRAYRKPLPKVGEILWCPRCQKDASVVDAPPSWSIRCESCIYSRSTGAGKTNAEITAAKHRMRHPGHSVRIYNGKLHVRTFGDRNQTVIPMTPESDQIPPF